MGKFFKRTLNLTQLHFELYLATTLAQRRHVQGHPLELVQHLPTTPLKVE